MTKREIGSAADARSLDCVDDIGNGSEVRTVCDGSQNFAGRITGNSNSFPWGIGGVFIAQLEIVLSSKVGYRQFTILNGDGVLRGNIRYWPSV